jgi:hypothetical protein
MNTQLIAFFAAACMSAVAVAQTTPTGQTGTAAGTAAGTQNTTTPQTRPQTTLDAQNRANNTGLNQNNTGLNQNNTGLNQGNTALTPNDINRNKAADCLDMDTNRNRNMTAGNAPRTGGNVNCDNTNGRKTTMPPPVRQP